MGMGEPLLNFENVIKSLHLFNQEVGIGMRKFTISTVGIVPKIRELAQHQLQLTLAVSLHAPDDETRRALLPVARKWNLAELMAACREYYEITGRRVTFEYILLKEVNDTPEHAYRLDRLLRDFPCLINLIPFNFVTTPEGFQRPEPERIQRFRSILEDAGLQVTQRVERGHEIDAACGQLRGKHLGRKAFLAANRHE
jgi:23S rRNA (adenine2503-C2)-methyltransferase